MIYILFPIIGFICGFLADLVWALYINALSKKKKFRAANLAVILYIISLYATISVVQNNIFGIIAYGAGCWCGTFYGVKNTNGK